MNIFQKLYHNRLKIIQQNFLNSEGLHPKKVIPNGLVSKTKDLQSHLEAIRLKLKPKSKIFLSYHNHIWEPVLDFASAIGLRKRVGIQNWFDSEDIKNILNLSGYKIIQEPKNYMLSLIVTIVAESIAVKESSHHSVSIIIPARNEEGNITKIVSSVPKFGRSQQIIFIEGHSKDKTWEEIVKVCKNTKDRKIIALKQHGTGKADAVKLGFDNATGDILMIYDADMTVEPNDLKKFYNAIVNKQADFINGSRLVYPMEQDAMRTLNKIGNKLFGILFSWILQTRFKDTLCGTKVLWRRDYKKYEGDYTKYLKVDPFGDFALIFTAVKNNLKIIEVPVRYKERVYGSTNIKRFKNGLQLFKMTLTAFAEFKL